VTDDPNTLHNSVIRKHGKIWLPLPLQPQIIRDFHAAPMGGHSGKPVILRCLKQLFFWQGMAKLVQKFAQLHYLSTNKTGLI
jgi:hypothetical protein